MADLLPALPEPLIECILARLPFPHIVKVRMLSKAWAVKLASKQKALDMWRTLQLAHDVLRPLDNTFFQREVTSVSGRWPTFFPVFSKQNEFIGFERTSSRWHRIFIHPLLPTTRSFPPRLRLAACWGSLLTIVYTADARAWHLRVENLLTGSWVDRDVPTPPFALRYPAAVHVITRGCYDYKVLLLYPPFNAGGAIRVTGHVFDPALNSWRCVQSEFPLPNGIEIYKHVFSLRESSLVHGETVYFLSCGHPYVQLGLWKFDTNMEELTANFFHFRLRISNRYCLASLYYQKSECKLVLLIRQHGDESASGYIPPGYQAQYFIQIVPVNLQTLEFRTGDMSLSPPTKFGGGSRFPVIKMICQEGYIYLCITDASSTVLQSIWTYDVYGQEWAPVPSIPSALTNLYYLDWMSSPFAPGLNPFADV